MLDKVTAKVVTATEASNNFGSMVDEAAKGRSYFVVTRMGKARAVVLGIEQYIRLLDDLEIKEEQANVGFQNSLREARKEYELGKVLSEDEFDREFGFDPGLFSGKDQS
ncbi:MAG: type II toxin-antitoxin system Phd/YefM family antitoxin [Anaerolineales bacterium]